MFYILQKETLINIAYLIIFLDFYQICVSIIDATDLPTLSIFKATMFLLCIKNATICFYLPLCVSQIQELICTLIL
jgi:hypothetical protein